MKPNKTYFVICANDSIEYVIEADKELATQRMAELKEDSYRRAFGMWTDREEFDCRIYWHLHEVKGEGKA